MINTEIQFAFFGTPELSTIILDELYRAGFSPSVVVTNPDRPRGRGQKIASPEVKVWAEEQNVPVLQPEKVDATFIDKLNTHGPFDVFIVAAYGNILPKDLLDIPRHGSLNVHPSLLPKQRGAAPIRGAILEEDRTGVTIMLMDEKLDHGPIVAQEEVVSWSKENGGPPKAEELEDRLAHAGGRLLSDVLIDWVDGNIEAAPQNHENATYTGKFSKEDGEIDLSDNPYHNFRKIQAFHRWPRSYFFTRDGRRVIITEAAYTDGKLNIQKVIPEGEEETVFDTFQH